MLKGINRLTMDIYFGSITVLELWGLDIHLSDITESTVPGRWKYKRRYFMSFRKLPEVNQYKKVKGYR